jgi:protein-S-isoprenylcysteine O-methyltransferase Ste14
MTIGGVSWAGLALDAAAFVLALVAAGRFVFRRTTLNPAGQPSQLVVSGAHAWSRNPMYLALTIIYAGAALALGDAWPLVLVVLPWAAVIPLEEARRRDTFVERRGAGFEPPRPLAGEGWGESVRTRSAPQARRGLANAA